MTTPPPGIQATADAYQCGHCDNAPATPVRDPHDTWHLLIWHAPTCPVLRGTLSPSPDLARAEAATTP